MNTITVQLFIKSFTGELDLTKAVTVMQEKPEKINTGDLSELEATLAAQVVSLKAVLNTLAGRSAANKCGIDAHLQQDTPNSEEP